MIKSIVNIGFQAVVKLVLSVVSLKVVAYYAGPSGMAVVGQLQSFLQMAGAGASAITSTGVVKLISEGREPEDTVVKSAFFLLLGYTVILLFIFSLSANWIVGFFLEGSWWLALIIIPFAALCMGINSLFVSYYNGRQNYQRYLVYSILLSFFTVTVTMVCALFFQKNGAIYSVVIAPIVASVIISFFFRGWMRNGRMLSVPEFSPIAKVLMQFSFMAIGSAIVVYGGQIYLRYFIADNVSATAAGIWYSATRLSDIYIGISSVLFSTILLPRYSTLEGAFLTLEVKKMLLLASIFALVMVVCVNVASGWVVHIIYGASFDEASGILNLYVIGDALKVITWIFLYVFIAKQKVLFYLSYEMLSAFGYVASSIMAFKYLDFDSMALGYVLQVSISLAILVYWFLRLCRTPVKSVEVAHD